MSVKNPAGTIQPPAWVAIKKALEKRYNILVDGEEDLFVIPVVILAHPRTLVVYGVPNKGIALIEANLKNKLLMRLILKRYFRQAKN